MKFKNLGQDKGVAGLTILLSLVTMIFVIGLLVMIFVLMGGEIRDSDTVRQSENSGTVVQNGGTLDEVAVTLTACSGANNGEIATITITNGTTGTNLLGNFTYDSDDCTYTVSTGGASGVYNGSVVNVSYTFTYAGTSWQVMNDTTEGLSSTTDWYDIFIVIGAMVVLILLTVIIITAIRGSGLMVGSGKSSGNVGYA